MTDWTKPTMPSDAEMAFPAEPKMPKMSEIPDDWPKKEHWLELQRKWFFDGLGSIKGFVVKEGIDPKTAVKHLHTIQASFAPKHEHKELAVAWLASLWFEDWVPGEGTDKAS